MACLSGCFSVPAPVPVLPPEGAVPSRIVPQHQQARGALTRRLEGAAHLCVVREEQFVGCQ